MKEVETFPNETHEANTNNEDISDQFQFVCKVFYAIMK